MVFGTCRYPAISGTLSLTGYEFLCGVAIDVMVGDPHWLPHPIRLLGAAITQLERLWRFSGLPLLLAGAGHTLCVVVLAAGLVWATLPWLTVYWVWSLLAIRSLDREAHFVIQEISSGNLPAARHRLSMIVGRDTANLTETEVMRAVLETVSENFSDAVVGPLLWLAVGGPVAMAAYKAVSTLDSMVGYKNERYRYFGTAAARLDDLLNFVPARLSVLLIAAAALPLRMRATAALRMAVRDGNSQPSPNSGYPEAAFAGALAVRLGGVSTYAGIPSFKHHLGDDDRPISVTVYREARRLYWLSCAIAVCLTWAVAR